MNPQPTVTALPTPWIGSFGGLPTLLCPACGFWCTHINRVTMLDAAGHHLTLNGQGDGPQWCTLTAETESPTGLTHHGDRQTVALTIDCEGCSYQSTLYFRQHKGSTHIEISSIIVDRD